MLNSKVCVKGRQGHKGLFAKHRIRKREVVWVLDPSEQLMTKESALLLPREYLVRVYQVWFDRYVLATDGSQYMNHSCDPNTWWEGNNTLVARHDIEVGEELTYDYATTEVEPLFPEDWKCACGARICRGVVTPADCLDPIFQQRFKGHLPYHTIQFIALRKKIAG